jgi:hypothetical protein
VRSARGSSRPERASPVPTRSSSHVTGPTAESSPRRKSETARTSRVRARSRVSFPGRRASNAPSLSRPLAVQIARARPSVRQIANGDQRDVAILRPGNCTRGSSGCATNHFGRGPRQLASPSASSVDSTTSMPGSAGTGAAAKRRATTPVRVSFQNPWRSASPYGIAGLVTAGTIAASASVGRALSIQSSRSRARSGDAARPPGDSGVPYRSLL